MPNLYLAMYHSAVGIYEHCPLYLENDIDIVYEVIGEILNFKLNVLYKNLAHTKCHKQNIFFYSINAIDMQDFENVVSAGSLR